MRNTFLVAWVMSALALLLGAVALAIALKKQKDWILIVTRGRYSLTQLQVVLWTVLVLSLIAAVAFVRILTDGVVDPLKFAIPDELLIVIGISVGSTVAATVIKSEKDAGQPSQIAASDENEKPRWAQIVTIEEGQMADKAIDVTKYQNAWLTLILIVAYVVLVVKGLPSEGNAATFALPGFGDRFLYLPGLSHAGYLAGKLPNRPGTPNGLTVKLKQEGAQPLENIPLGAEASPRANRPRYVPRNP